MYGNDKQAPGGVQVRGLDFGWTQRPLFAQWSADFPAGLSLVLGGEGAGKTSLLRLLAAEWQPHSGTVVFRGIVAADQPDRYRAQAFWRDPRSPWQDIGVDRWIQSVRDRYPTWDEAAWDKHVAGFGLQPHRHKSMHQLSSGSQRKVLLAGALASGAPLTLLDEPDAALDRSSITYLHTALADAGCAAAAAGRVLIVAHYDRFGALPWHQLVKLSD